QRIEHALHRPTTQRFIAIKCSRHRSPRYGADCQAAAGAGITEIEHASRFREPANADTMNAPSAVARALHPRAEGPHGVGGMQDVLALQKTADSGFADRKGPEDQGAVRYRLIARHAGAALQGAA